MNELNIMNRQIVDQPVYLYNRNGDRMDVAASPMMESQNTSSFIENTERKGKPFGAYTYHGVPVPRVTSILDYCMGDREYLLQWAANLGSKYNNEKRKTLDIGSKLHEAIAEYMVSGTLYTIQHLRGPVKEEVANCFRNFLAWYDHIKRIGWKIEVVTSEVPLICPWFGGTADLIVVLNGRRYVIDFKSSKRIYDEYLIQVSAYKWLIDNYYPEYGPIDGIGILRFDKVKNVYEDLFFDVKEPSDYAFIQQCQWIFGCALNMFYATNVFHQNFARLKRQKEQRKGRVSNRVSNRTCEKKKGRRNE